MNKILKPIAILGLMAFTFYSCSEGTEKKKKGETDADTTMSESDNAFGFQVMDEQSYQVPSPNELFLIIKNSELPYKDGLVEATPQNYETRKARALNFGRLTADIAYTASYEKFQESMENFENLRKLATDLGIDYVFDELMVNRVKNNMDNADSLEIISNNSYISIINKLEQNGEEVTLAIVSAGGFVESIYILSQLIGDYESNAAAVQRLADQKLVMENILDYLNQYSDDASVQEIIKELEPISNIYLNLKEENASPAKQEGDGKVVLGGDRVLMSKEEFEGLKKAAKNYRDSFSNAQNGNS